ncbi:MAG: SIR2 family protein [Dehalococcoidia bacterium]
MKILVFAGAGASVELGVPAMAQLAMDFRRHVGAWKVEPELLGLLLHDQQDLEDLIEKLDGVCGSSEALEALGFDQVGMNRARSLQSEVEWFVQHACERVTSSGAELMWSSVLASTTSHEVVVATTNYDRAIELAANAMGLALRDGFEPFGTSEVASWCDFPSSDGFAGNGCVTLLKLHGSTDWYELGGRPGQPVKLRHPMPLFGGGALRLPSVSQELTAALILPSREKRVTRPPYLRLSQVFLNAAERADVIIFIGSSFRDPHLRSAARTSAQHKPTFLVSRSNPNSTEILGAVRIQATASQFLLSMLPRALNSIDPISTLTQIAAARPKAVDVFDLVGSARDPRLSTSVRCAAIEGLWGDGIALGATVVVPLLADADDAVARFALGLVADSFDATPLLATARQRAERNGSHEFHDELAILESLVKQPG